MDKTQHSIKYKSYELQAISESLKLKKEYNIMSMRKKRDVKNEENKEVEEKT